MNNDALTRNIGLTTLVASGLLPIGALIALNLAAYSAAIFLYAAAIVAAIAAGAHLVRFLPRTSLGEKSMGGLFLAFVASCLHPFWAWFTAASLSYSDQLMPPCAGLPPESTSVHTLYLPPAVLCAPGPDGMPVGVTPLSTTLTASLLLLLLLAMSVVGWLIVRHALVITGVARVAPEQDHREK
ncbi:hypothetical protein [Salinibacterium sp. ZJ454]|uniref:hypothetical protein n=1 Tax=Salinibacterium sp. ZJ454 TaxID=2708339 RepID=UPI00142232D6|nr:hypothetical protein [Salinibacterium sp. ZJ454]